LTSRAIGSRLAFESIARNAALTDRQVQATQLRLDFLAVSRVDYEGGRQVLNLQQNDERRLLDGGGTDATRAQTEGRGGDPSVRHEEIWLLGQPPLSRYLDFVAEDVVDGEHANRAALIDEWRAANDYYQELERSEAGVANQIEHSDPGPSLDSLAVEVQRHPRYRQGFDALPTRIRIVELDRLIAYQKHVSRNFIDRLKRGLPPVPDQAALFRFCLPLDTPDAPVQVRQVGSRRYVFRCDSTDFRFQKATLLAPEQMSSCDGYGAVGGIVGLVVGFGSNFVNAVQVGKRLMLNNGYHRVCALRALGIKHAPCIVQTATRVDELAIAVKRELAEQAEFYFESARPPLIKDFFDRKIRKVLPVEKSVRQIEVTFEVKDFLVPE
jgi:hypothetical protein